MKLGAPWREAGLLRDDVLTPMPSVAMVKDVYSSFARSISSSILAQVAKLMKEKLASDEFMLTKKTELIFLVSTSTHPPGGVQVLLKEDALQVGRSLEHHIWKAAGEPVDVRPSHIKQALETRLRSLGYSVTISTECFQFSSSSANTTQTL
jgi:hypothetical protein